MRDHGGKIPDTVKELLELPGIGPYTAAAVASLAFKLDVAALDGNIKRVMTRLCGYKNPTATELHQACQAALPHGRAGPFNEALMDLGASICTPRAPNCIKCPVRRHCKAFSSGNPDQYASPKKRGQVPQRHVTTIVAISKGNKWLMTQRPSRGLLGGLWEFPTIASAELSGACAALTAQTGVAISPKSAIPLGEIKQVFTHFKLMRAVFLLVDVCEKPCKSRTRWVDASDISNLALTKGDLRIRDLVLSKRTIAV